MRNQQIIKMYVAGQSAQEIGDLYGITPRTVQRIVKDAGKSRTIKESFRLAIDQGRMKYYKKPEHLKVKRHRLSDKLRYTILKRDDYRCRVCGATALDGVRIEVDHIDNDATNNNEHNLQVLCNRCNQGKAFN